MAMERSCQSFQEMLSAYVDGETAARERAQVELHLSGCADCRARVEDLRTLSTALSAHLQARADEADFTDFASAVMRRVTPDRPGLLERLRIAWAEVLTYHRTAVISSLATAAVTLAVAVPVVYEFATEHAGAPEVVLQDLKLDDAHVKPVVMKLDNGKTLIMLVHDDEPGENQAATPDVSPEPPKEGNL